MISMSFFLVSSKNSTFFVKTSEVRHLENNAENELNFCCWKFSLSSVYLNPTESQLLKFKSAVIFPFRALLMANGVPEIFTIYWNANEISFAWD